MAETAPKTISLKNYQHCLQVEHTAGGTIRPGMLIALGSAGTVVAHAVAGGTAPERMFALEDDAQGRGIDDNYDATTYKNVRAIICSPGAEIYAFAAGPAAIVIGDKLESAGDGMLREHIPQSGVQTSPGVGGRTGQVVAIALEAKTLASPGTDSRIRVRVI